MPDALLAVRATPRASRDAIAGVRDGVVQVRVSAPPADGRANAAICRLVAKHLRLAPSRVSIVRGERSRSKTLRIEGLSAEVVRHTFAAHEDR
jgi:uncharacterized protein (TIGR00251 family)